MLSPMELPKTKLTQYGRLCQEKCLRRDEFGTDPGDQSAAVEHDQRTEAAACAGCLWLEQRKLWVKVGSFWPNESWAGIADPCAKGCDVRDERDGVCGCLHVA